MTERLYYTDSYLQAFSARVVAARPDDAGIWLELDRTAFYPLTGGQRSDRGVLGGLPVEEVCEEEERILHRINGPAPNPGTIIEGRIDWEIRFDHMQQHSAQHLLSHALVETCDARTESFHMSAELSTIDLDVGTLEPEQLWAAEDLANRIIFENRPIDVRFVDSSEQATLDLRKPSERAGTLRIVEIRDFDRSACGGTHCRTTGEIGMIRILGLERVRKRLRLEFAAGWRALRRARRAETIVTDLSRLLSVGGDSLGEAVRKLTMSERSAWKEAGDLREKLLFLDLDRAAADPRKGAGFELVTGVWEGLDPKQLNQAATRVLQAGPGRIAILGANGDRGFLVLAKDPVLASDLRILQARAQAHCGGKGGGSPDRIQIGGCDPARIAEAVEQLADTLLRGNPESA